MVNKYLFWVHSIQALTGRQVTDVEDFYRRLGGETLAEDIPLDIFGLLQDLLEELGYEQRWFIPACGGAPVHKWAREPWPFDGFCLSSYVVGSMLPGRYPVAAYVPY